MSVDYRPGEWQKTFASKSLISRGPNNDFNVLRTTTIPRLPGVTTELLKNEVFSTPIETLKNLWLAKYGDAWVEESVVAEDAFFGLAAQRLRSVAEFIYLVDTQRNVIRILP